jgi:citrate synthase
MTDPRTAAKQSVSMDEVTDWWSTAISDIEPGVIRLRGYPVEQLIRVRTSFAEMAWLMLRGELPQPEQAALLELALVAAVDHGPQAPSIAAARMAATCGIGINSAVATGVNLLGDVHGGAGQQCMSILRAVHQRVSEAAGTSDNSDAAPHRSADIRSDVVAELLAEHRASKRYIPGFGHRFHPIDPRRDPLLEAVEEQVHAGSIRGNYLRVALEIERQLQLGRSRPVPMNIDGATAVIYSELGFEPELGRGLFVLSRSVGILAHAWEQQGEGRRIKGPIPPPLLPAYAGPPLREIS